MHTRLNALAHHFRNTEAIFMETLSDSLGTIQRGSRGLVGLLMLGVLACSSSPSGDTGSMQPNGGSAGTSGGGSPGGGGVMSGGGIMSGGSTATAGSGTAGSLGVAGGAGLGGVANTGGAAGRAGTAGSQGPSFGGAFGGGGGGKASPGGGAGRGGAAATAGASPGGAAGTSGSGSMGSKGCGSAAAPKSGRFDIDVDGTMREYILAVPDDYDSGKPYRLVFGWHPLGGSADQVARGGYYGVEREAAGEAIFVSPEGLPFQGMNLGWANMNGRDLAFLRKMLDRFRQELCIDEDRIFSTGFSFGGMMSFAVGCSGLMRAIAPQAGNIQVSGCEDGTKPVAVMGFHGDDDTVVAIDGGRRGRDTFVERNQCMDQTMPVEPSWCDGLNASNEPCSCVSYQGCSAGYPVIWCEFNGPHTPAPNSGAAIWKFFSQF